jgi:hypothetical protein
MSGTKTESATGVAAGTELDGLWKSAVVSGIVGAVVMGALMATTSMVGVLEMAIPAMYTIQGPAGTLGFTIHVAHGAILGLGFLGAARLIEVDSLVQCIAAGAAYGVVLWIVAAVLVMPLWLQAVGFGGAPPFPNVSVMSLVGHVVYGLVLGAVFPFVRSL